MQALASYIMRGRLQAVMTVVMFAGLSFLLPPFTSPLSFFSGAALTLVTLRLGPQQGVWVLLLAAVTLGLFSLLSLSNVVPAVAVAGAIWIPAWLLAVVLRRTVSWSQTMTVALAMGMALVLAIFAALGDPVEWFYQALEENLKPLLLASMTGVDQADATIEQLLRQLSQGMTGTVAMAVVTHALICLLLGRWWQATLYNPGGFKTEFLGLRLGKALAGIAVLLLALDLAGTGHLVSNLLLVAEAVFVLQGLAVVHAIASAKGLHSGWLAPMYVLMPFLMGLLALMGVVDVWADFRARAGVAKTKDS
ncbi:MAG: hypothetical protein A2V90_03365 [Gammaproteobacteria bacterium RBG_16_57_12]|nr:MAG: hypothetical protein A2V90_03365 [Gammaproteobacteria bacterium RBG_16_57_12]